MVPVLTLSQINRQNGKVSPDSAHPRSILDTGYWILDTVYWRTVLDPGELYWILENCTGSWILDTGYWLLEPAIGPAAREHEEL